jgi:hypothetical protein
MEYSQSLGKARGIARALRGTPAAVEARRVVEALRRARCAAHKGRLSCNS